MVLSGVGVGVEVVVVVVEVGGRKGIVWACVVSDRLVCSRWRGDELGVMLVR